MSARGGLVLEKVLFQKKESEEISGKLISFERGKSHRGGGYSGNRLIATSATGKETGC